MISPFYCFDWPWLLRLMCLIFMAFAFECLVGAHGEQDMYVYDVLHCFAAWVLHWLLWLAVFTVVSWIGGLVFRVSGST